MKKHRASASWVFFFGKRSWKAFAPREDAASVLFFVCRKGQSKKIYRVCFLLGARLGEMQLGRSAPMKNKTSMCLGSSLMTAIPATLRSLISAGTAQCWRALASQF